MTTQGQITLTGLLYVITASHWLGISQMSHLLSGTSCPRQFEASVWFNFIEEFVWFQSFGWHLYCSCHDTDLILSFYVKQIFSTKVWAFLTFLMGNQQHRYFIPAFPSDFSTVMNQMACSSFKNSAKHDLFYLMICFFKRFWSLSQFTFVFRLKMHVNSWPNKIHPFGQEVCDYRQKVIQQL